MYLDEHLSWKHHINFVCKQMAKSVGILSRTRFYLSCKTKLMLCYRGRCELLQIQNIEHRHTAPLFTKLKILDIFQINTLDIAKFMSRYHNNLLPPLFLNLFMTNSQVHKYDTRTADNYRVHPCRRTSRNSLFFTKDLRSGTVLLPLLPICQAFLRLKAKC